VELDIWDGPNMTPVITHGYTLVNSVKLEDVVRVIADSAFVSSPYPIVLSLEMHCGYK
jgi:phosphatidylinositol phospholipase C delta